MIKAHNISFYRLLSTGYISAETFRALMPKQGLYDLSFSDCYQYEGNCRIELKRLFEDDQVISSIEHMEKLEKEIDTSNIGPFVVLDKCLSDYGGIVSHIINTLIGRKAFLLDYVYCTKEMLSSLNYVDEDNYSSFLEFIETYRIAYENYSPNPDGKSDLCVTDLELLDDIKPTTVSDTKIEEPIKSGEGFAAKDIISIDEDALSVSNTECRKYVLFLYTLSKDELNPVIDYLINLLSNFSIRTLNGVRSIGLRNFLVNYLFSIGGGDSMINFNSAQSYATTERSYGIGSSMVMLFSYVYYYTVQFFSIRFIGTSEYEEAPIFIKCLTRSVFWIVLVSTLFLFIPGIERIMFYNRFLNFTQIMAIPVLAYSLQTAFKHKLLVRIYYIAFVWEAATLTLCLIGKTVN